MLLIATTTATTTTAAVSATTAAATTAAAIFTASAAAGRTFFTGTGDIDGDCAAIQFLAVHGGNGFLRFFIRAHGDESESAGAIGRAVHHQIGFGDRSVSSKRVVQVVFGGLKGKIPNEQFIIHAICN